MSARLPIIRGALKVAASRLFVTRQAPLGWLVRDEDDLPTEVALDDAFWDQFNRDYDAWYAEHPLPGVPGRPQP